MYPLLIVLSIGILFGERSSVLIALILSICGLAIAIFHNLLYYKVIPESITPCTGGVSCSTVQIEWLGFVTIPLLALGTFGVLVIVLMYVLKTFGGNGEKRSL